MEQKKTTPSEESDHTGVRVVPLFTVLPHCSLFAVQSRSKPHFLCCKTEPPNSWTKKEREGSEVDIVGSKLCGPRLRAILVELLILEAWIVEKDTRQERCTPGAW